ncbi:MAG: MotA/TolQ/ExbB proton channel family protein [Acidobacteriota bacterium]|nr:MotA/TolQ/ExbB proton channel family protein [Acidobacteriota bacterium]
MQSGVLDAAERACQRSAATTNLEMKRGVDSLIMIAQAAPSLGIFALVTGIMPALKSFWIPHWECDCAGGPAEVFVLPAVGLFIASVTMFFHGFLSAKLEQFRMEMEAASLQLMNDLVRPSTNI